PMTALEPGDVGPFWQALGPALERLGSGKPSAIISVSAHTLTREPVLLAAAQQPTVHDFGGFPDALYRLNYDSPGAPALAARVAERLHAAGLPAHTVNEGGLDHGVWAPLRFIWPEPGIPILPLGFPPDWSPARLFALGEALAGLADDVLVIGSGSITHNLRLLSGSATRPSPDSPERPDSAAFRRWFADRLAARDWDALFDYRSRAPHAALMHPTDEHLLPIYVAAGAGGRDAVPARLHDSITYGCLGMDAYAFGDAAASLSAGLAG
ncbi:MAG: dioxygenase, partial [Burkholderiales bacterium]|nr:dioxygenase [Burkholderiales bacterium]